MEGGDEKQINKKRSQSLLGMLGGKMAVCGE